MKYLQIIVDELKGDKVIWAITIFLSLLSILVVYSATGSLAYKSYGGDTEYFLIKHSLLVVISLIATYLCHNIHYKYYSRLSRIALIISVPLLLIAWQFGTTLNQASRWITIPLLKYSFQPSDLAKLALIANLASMLSKRQLSIHEFERAIMPVIIWCGIICGLIGVSDWSTASLLFMTCLLLMFIGRVPIQNIIMLIVVGVIAGMFAFTFGQRGQTVRSRLAAYTDATHVPFQVEQSYIAIATGGILGKGIGQSTQRNFLPHPYSDFVFAIIVEEYGTIFASFIIFLYLVFLYRSILIVARTERAFGGLLAAGLAFSIVVQAFVHIGVSIGLLPVTGLPLPLLSMGGTSLIFTGMSIGIILSVSRSDEEFNQDGNNNSLQRFINRFKQQKSNEPKMKVKRSNTPISNSAS
ncbi:MAG: FtsW/RodA/SpoVE family cell cycle protein [Cytophagales bacterium]|nr:FtsW/RodA/SpoVE family cell cycle protein [Cytophagales bacterium]